jgi:hypothetical protein
MTDDNDRGWCCCIIEGDRHNVYVGDGSVRVCGRSVHVKSDMIYVSDKN